MDRFDFTKPQRDLLNLCVSLDVVDAVELGCMMALHTTNFNALLDELTECAHASRHCTESSAARSEFHAACSAYWKTS